MSELYKIRALPNISDAIGNVGLHDSKSGNKLSVIQHLRLTLTIGRNKAG